ncbi:hypothetical protein RRG08_015884 [Elysia crispata]|uniref:Reverse transcriptase domain-containing protein n=1 Tax=Elysia crispata TaxID=231223 RepID=A0AAE0YLS0_9GAST|nr:hypothetical protein RRG08_015884 [Elysia crispata]
MYKQELIKTAIYGFQLRTRLNRRRDFLSFNELSSNLYYIPNLLKIFIWLDLVNAYGSVPHQMIQLALRMYHVPEDIQVMLDDYFSGFRMRFSTNSYTTDWINLEIGIAMGCTISPILFVIAMEVSRR